MRSSTSTSNDCVKFCAGRMLIFFVCGPYTSTNFTDGLIVGKKCVIKSKVCAEYLLHLSNFLEAFLLLYKVLCKLK